MHFASLTVIFFLYQSVMYPAAQALWSNWAPPNERSRLIGFSYAGGQFGNAIIFPIGGFLCAYGFDSALLLLVAVYEYCSSTVGSIHDHGQVMPGSVRDIGASERRS